MIYLTKTIYSKPNRIEERLKHHNLWKNISKSTISRPESNRPKGPSCEFDEQTISSFLRKIVRIIEEKNISEFTLNELVQFERVQSSFRDLVQVEYVLRDGFGDESE